MKKNNQVRIGCLLMAAGNASRFRTNKLLVDFDGKPLVQRAMEAIARDRFAEIVVVTQYPDVTHMAQKFGYTCIQNDHPEWGAAYTIRLGTEALRRCNAIMYMVADQPLLEDVSVERLVDVWREHPCNIIAPSHDGRTGNPCIFPREFYDELMALEGDVGGKAVIRRHMDKLLTVELAAQELVDCDTPEALRRLKQETKE